MQAKSISIDTGEGFLSPQVPQRCRIYLKSSKLELTPESSQLLPSFDDNTNQKNIYIYRNFYKLVRWNLLKTQDYLDYKRHTTQHKNQTQYSEDPRKKDTPKKNMYHSFM
jgi:hypothetical protein